MRSRSFTRRAGRTWLLPLALAMLCLMLAAAVMVVVWLAKLLLGLTVIFFLAAGWFAVKGRLKGRYDLSSLQEVHDREELRAIDPGEVSDEADTIVCPHCGQDRKARFRICPNCKV